jgi:hypothetical protein
VTVVVKMLVLDKYDWVKIGADDEDGLVMEKCPPSGSKSRPNTGGLSGRGKHIHSTLPVALMRAEV